MCLYEAQNSGECLQDNWSSGFILYVVTAAGVVLCGSLSHHKLTNPLHC